MPEIGEIRSARDLGYKDSHKFIWHACLDCGRESWVAFRHGLPRSQRCKSCAPKHLASNPWRARGERHSSWRGGRRINSQGYVLVWIHPDNFFYPMADKNGHILEHRLVMAKKLGRCLQPWEHVHHKGIRYTGLENKQDNLEDNLELTTSGSHIRAHQKGYKDGYAKGLEDGRDKQIRELKEEIRLLRWQLKERRGVL